MNKLISILNKFVPILPFVFIFITSLYTPKDPDLGWHLKYGEYFFKNFRILRENTFSTMMPDFYWANSSWLTDLITYLGFNYLGFFGLTLLSSLIITFTFYFFSKAAKLRLWDQTLLFPILFYLEKPLLEVSFRGQLISNLFLGILFYLVQMYQDSKSKRIFLVIPLFFLWVNLHGQYILGLGLFTLWVIFYLANQFFILKEDLNIITIHAKKLFILLILSFLATLINPFGVEIYKTTITHFSNPDLKFIAEYLPLEDLSVPWWNQITLGVLIGFGAIFLFLGGVFKSKEEDSEKSLKENLPYLGIIFILYGLTFFIRRYAWSLYFLTLSFLKPVSEYFMPEQEKTIKRASLFFLIILISMSVMLKQPFNKFWQVSWDSYCQAIIGCSTKSAEFLQNYNYDPDKLLTFYDWGGFLIWNYPQIKPSIDGRMHLWRDTSGYSGFEDYYGYEQNFKDINSSKYDIVLINNTKPLYRRLAALAREKKWELVYSDKRASVFIKVKNGTR